MMTTGPTMTVPTPTPPAAATTMAVAPVAATTGTMTGTTGARTTTMTAGMTETTTTAATTDRGGFSVRTRIPPAVALHVPIGLAGAGALGDVTDAHGRTWRKGKGGPI